MKTTRLDYLDAIAGLLIVRMILGHLFQCCLLTETETYWWMNTVFSFFMPWFFYKSGMLFVISVGVNDCNSIFYIKLRGRKILLPWLSFSLLSLAVVLVVLVIKGDTSLVHYIAPIKSLFMFGAISTNLPLWFLLTLFIVYVLNFFITKYKVNRIVVAVACVALAALFQYVGFKYPATITSSLLGLSFYQLGYLLKKKQFDRKFIIAISVIGIVPMCVCPSVTDVCTNSNKYGLYVIWYIYSLAAIVLINNLFKSIKYYSFPVLRYIGRNAITFLVTYWIVRIIMLETLDTRGYEMFVLMCIVMATVLPVLSELFNRDKLKVFIGK